MKAALPWLFRAYRNENMHRGGKLALGGKLAGGVAPLLTCTPPHVYKSQSHQKNKQPPATASYLQMDNPSTPLHPRQPLDRVTSVWRGGLCTSSKLTGASVERQWSNDYWKEPRTLTPLAPGAKRNWASEADNVYAEKERSHARLLAKATAGMVS